MESEAVFQAKSQNNFFFYCIASLDVEDCAGAALAAVLLLPLPVRARADDGRALEDAAQLDLSRARSRRKDDNLQCNVRSVVV